MYCCRVGRASAVELSRRPLFKVGSEGLPCIISLMVCLGGGPCVLCLWRKTETLSEEFFLCCC
jgi:hypothetical protein